MLYVFDKNVMIKIISRSNDDYQDISQKNKIKIDRNSATSQLIEASVPIWSTKSHS